MPKIPRWRPRRRTAKPAFMSPAFLDQVRETAAFTEVEDLHHQLSMAHEEARLAMEQVDRLEAELGRLHTHVREAGVPSDGLPAAAVQVVIPAEGDAVFRHLPHLTETEVWSYVYRAAEVYAARHGIDVSAVTPLPQPGDVVTEEPPVGSIIRDRDGDLQERSTAGWHWHKVGGVKGDADPWTWQFVSTHFEPLTLVRWGPA